MNEGVDAITQHAGGILTTLSAVLEPQFMGSFIDLSLGFAGQLAQRASDAARKHRHIVYLGW